MTITRALRSAATGLALLLVALAPAAAQYPAPKEGSWVARDFRFHTGEVMPELRLHYRTVGEPTGEPVLILHGTTGSGAGMLTPGLRRRAVRPRPAARCDASTSSSCPDAIGHGKSSKPSDGLRAKFPRYNYDDMVAAQYRLVTEGPRHPPPAPGARQLDGRHAHLDLGRRAIPTSWTRWCRWPRSRPRCRAATG